MTDDRLTGKDMNGLSLPDLAALLNRQIVEHRKLQESQAETRARLSAVTQNISNLKARISRFSAAQTPVQVTDHAIVRYLERVCGIDLDVVRAALDTPELRECVQRCATGRHTINGITYVTQDKALVTVIYEGEPRADAPRPEMGARP